MNDELPEIFYDHRLVVGVPKSFKQAVVRAARDHQATVSDFVRYALNEALSKEPIAGRDGDFSLIPTITARSIAMRITFSRS